MNQSIRPVMLGLLISLSVPTHLAGQDILDYVRTGDVGVVQAMLSTSPALIRCRDEQGRTPLHVASDGGQAEMVKALLAAGPDVDAVDAEGASALQMAALGGHRAVVELLLGAGADVNLRNEQTGFSAIDLAFQAESRGGSRLTRLLHSHGAEFDVDRLQRRMMNALDYAVENRSLDMVRFAIEQGADVNDTPYHAAPISWAALNGDADIARELIAAGADVNVSDPMGGVPLSWAVERGHTDAVRVLLRGGADAGWVDSKTGRNLLGTAALHGQPETVELLLSHGVPVNSTDPRGRTPLDYASRYGHRAVATLLRKHGAEHGTDPAENFGKSPHLTRTMEEGEAVAWYLAGRGWLVRTRRHLLVFDAEEFGVTRPPEPSLWNGFITADELAGFPVVALYTTYHGATGELAYIHELEDSLPEISYVHNGNDGFRGSGHTRYLTHGDETAIGDVRVTAIEIPQNRPDLAYLVRVDGVSIFYTGFRALDLERFRKALDPIRERVDRVDMAFLPAVTPDEDESDVKMFLEMFDPRAVMVLDPNLRTQLFAQMVDKVKGWGFASTVFAPENAGDSFVFGRR